MSRFPSRKFCIEVMYTLKIVFSTQTWILKVETFLKTFWTFIISLSFVIAVHILVPNLQGSLQQFDNRSRMWPHQHNIHTWFIKFFKRIQSYPLTNDDKLNSLFSSSILRDITSSFILAFENPRSFIVWLWFRFEKYS